MSKKKPHGYRVVGRGKAGWHAEGARTKWGTSSSSGGTLDGYLLEADNGALVYDADGADYATYSSFVIRGPMVDGELGPDAVSRFEDTESAGRMAPHLAGVWGTWAAAAATGTFRGLDKVGVRVYAALLRSLGGVRIGWVRDHAVTWESDPVEVRP